MAKTMEIINIMIASMPRELVGTDAAKALVDFRHRFAELLGYIYENPTKPEGLNACLAGLSTLADIGLTTDRALEAAWLLGYLAKQREH